MMKFIKTFFIFIVLYHILVTVMCYGFFWWQYQEAISLTRDGIRILFVLAIIATQSKQFKLFLSTRKYPLIALGILLLFGVGMSKRIGKSRYDIAIGIKYGLRYLIIFMSAIYIWCTLAYKNNKEYLIKFLHRLLYGLVIVVIIGFVWQIAKLIIPEIFHQIGYGPLRDFSFGDKPPIYYLTGYEGTLRRQGLFAGPNNYGYFLVAFLPAIILFFRQKLTSIKAFFSANKKTILNSTIIALRIATIALTLSRTAFIWGILGIALVNIQRIRKHKKIARGIAITLLVWLIGISILKTESTLGHIAAKFGSIAYIIEQPGWYGLGTSGPAIHHQGKILPENYYIQLILDIGTIGFILWSILILNIIRILKKIQQHIKEKDTLYIIWQGLNIGFFTLLIMGIFLHVFEDSMVNYLFFITWWILTGYLSNHIKKRD